MAPGASRHDETIGSTPAAAERRRSWPLSVTRSAWSIQMEAFLVSVASVAVAEMGDRTQLLALVLAARFRKPWPIVAGIASATLANHAAAGLVGVWIGRLLTPTILDAAVGAS